MKDFQRLIDAGLITQLNFDPADIKSVEDLSNKGLITQPGMHAKIKEWFENPENDLPEAEEETPSPTDPEQESVPEPPASHPEETPETKGPDSDLAPTVLSDVTDADTTVHKPRKPKK